MENHIIEIHSWWCNMNCKGCSFRNKKNLMHTPSVAIDAEVNETFELLQNKYNEINANDNKYEISLQYNVALSKIESDLSLNLKSNYIKQIWFNEIIEEVWSTDPVSDMKEHLVNMWLEKFRWRLFLLISTEDFLLWEYKRNLIYLRDEIINRSILRASSDRILNKYLLTVMQNWCNGLDIMRLEEKLYWEYKELRNLWENHNFSIKSNEYESRLEYSFSETNQVKFAKRLIGLNGSVNTNKEYLKIRIQQSIDRIQKGDLDKRFWLAIYPEWIWLMHDPIFAPFGKEYFMIDHEKFREFIENSTDTIDYKSLIKAPIFED